MHTAAVDIFWLCLFLIGYTYLGYGILVGLILKLRPRQPLPDAATVPAWAVTHHYSTSEPNSPSLTRVRIFIFSLTTAVVRMIWPRSFVVML